MYLNEYIHNNEKVVAQTTASTNTGALEETEQGTLAVTSNRVVFTHDKGAYDISLHRVDAIEYKEPSYPDDYLIGGIMLGGATFISTFILSAFDSLSDTQPFLILLFGVATVATFLIGYFLMKSKLILHTGSKSFKYISDDKSLDKIAHALRGRERR